MRELQARLEAERSSLTISVREFHAQQVEVTGSLTRSVEQKFASAMDAIDNLSNAVEGRIREAVSRLEARCGEVEARSLASEAAEDLHQQPLPQLQPAQQRWPGKAGTSANLSLKGAHTEETSPDLQEVLRVVCSDIVQLQGQCGHINSSMESLQKQQSSIRHDLQSHLKTLVVEVQSQLSSDAWEIQNQITGDMSQLMGEVEALRALHNRHSSELENVRQELKERCGALADIMGQHDENSRMTDEVLARLLSNLQALHKNQVLTSVFDSFYAQRAEQEGVFRTEVQAIRDVKQHHGTDLEVLRTQLQQEIESAGNSVRSNASVSRQPSLVGTLQLDLNSEALHTMQALQRQQSCNIEELQCEGREYGNELREMRNQISSEMQRIWKVQQENAEDVSGRVQALQGKVTEDHQSLKASEVSQAQISGTIRALKNNFKVLQIQQSRHTGEIEALQADLRRRSIVETPAAG